MPGSDTEFMGSIPEIYDRYLGPILFEPYAADLSRRVVQLGPKDVLEIAAGTGIVTRALLKGLPDRSSLVATDLNQPMVAHAARNTQSWRVTWRKADAAALPFENESFDVVVCQFGAMFFPDKPAAYREARRVLKPGGRFIFNVWGAIEQNDFAAIITNAVAAVFSDNPPNFFARIPHGYHDADAIRADLLSAGFGEVQIDTVELSGRAASARHAAIGLCQGTPLRNEIEARDPACLTEATEAAATALAERFGSGPISGRMAALVIEACK